MADTQIILKQNVPGLGAEADIVKVRKGFARNHLIPTGKAYEVTASNLKRLNQLKALRAEREARELNDAEDFARKLGKLKLEFALETGATGKAFGSVTTRDIEEKLRSEFGITIDRHKIDLERPIKESGEKEVPIKLHHDVTATLKIEIKSSTPPAPAHEKSEPAEAKPRGKRKAKPSV
ncbi:MAG: 50S ribosomal protein L9 [Verrucomicrobia bacterium]|nr:50S ribosomal protein L9 [Verrucomicrobiota bacterium]